MSIGALLDKLQPLQVAVDGNRPVALNVARDLKITHFPSGAAPVFLRVLKRGKGERDFANLQYLQSRLGDHVNGPTSVVTSDKYVCGVFPFVRHEKATHTMLIARKLLPEVGAILVKMHAAGRDVAPAGPTFAIHDGTAANGDVSAASFRRYVDSRFQAVIDHKAPVAQHCDFTYANLGLADDGRLIVFDWEEYGYVRYPAFDFATFLLSHHYRAGTIDDVLQSPESLTNCIDRDFGTAYLGNLGFAVADFTMVFPGYLSVFLALKRDFGVKIHDRIHTMWTRMLTSEAWTKAMSPNGA